MGQLLIAGEWVDGTSAERLHDKYTGAAYGDMAVASPAQVAAAVAGAVRGQERATLTPYGRFKVLSAAARIIESRVEPLIELMRHEAGFTRADGDNEVRRCVQTLELSAEEAKRLNGDMVPMHAGDGVKDRIGFTMRAPRGVICAITPFNAPVNTVAHKVAPALAAGNAVIVKPSSSTPNATNLIAQALMDAGLPEGLISVVHGGAKVAHALAKIEGLGRNFYRAVLACYADDAGLVVAHQAPWYRFDPVRLRPRSRQSGCVRTHHMRPPCGRSRAGVAIA